jgi:tRNA dimethylallyltransferase
MTPPVIIIVGPTASGKSAIAERLARERDGEIISADSAQVYIGMDKGTAKPDLQTRAEIKHHLIDLIPPTQQYNAQQFAKDAVAAVHDIQDRGKLPIICGGTMLYIRALIYGFDELPQTDGVTREAIALDGENLGS